jgi:hypothetical protein
MRFRIRLLAWAVILDAAAAGAAHAQAVQHVTAWEVRRACTQGASSQIPDIRDLCALTLPDQNVTDPASWREWRAWVERNGGVDAAREIRGLLQAFTPANLAVSEVFPDLPVGQQRMIAGASRLDRRSAVELRVHGAELVREAAAAVGRDVRVAVLVEDERVPEAVREEVRFAALLTAPEGVLERSYNALTGPERAAIRAGARGDRLASAAGETGLERLDFQTRTGESLVRPNQAAA